MKSSVVLSLEIEDLSVAVKELAAGIREKITLDKSAVGIVYSDADVDVGELGDRLHKELGIEIVGLTMTALIERNNGYCGMGIVLTVITGDDVCFAVGSAGGLDKDNYSECIRDAYANARAGLEQDPKLIILCCPYIADLGCESYMEVLDEASGQVPVFGGVASDNHNLRQQKTFHNGVAFADGVAFVLVSGNIKPAFCLKNHFSRKIERKSVITKSSAHVVERVDDKTFKEYFSEIIPVPTEETAFYPFLSTPFVLEFPDYVQTEQPVVRALSSINHQTGEGCFLAKMPEGTKLSINMLQREDLSASCADTLDDFIEKVRQTKDYEYTTILMSTCNVRHLLMGATKDMEAKIVAEKLSDFGPELNAVGFYGFGEVCPTLSNEDGRSKNRFHNVSFALCAF